MKKNSNIITKEGHLLIGDKITEINDYEYYNKNIIGITFSSNVKRIGYCAFKNNKIKRLKIPNSITFIDSYAFSNNEIEWLEIPNSVEYFGKAFENNPLTTLIVDKNYIDSHAFNHGKIKNLILGENVKLICGTAFANNRIKGELKIPDGIKNIEYSAFHNNKIESVVMSDSVCNLGSNAFSYNNITSAVLSNNLKFIDSGLFANNKLTNIKLPQGITYIDVEAFYNNNLTEIEIPNSVGMIKKEAFFKNNLTSVIIPDSVKHIGVNAFDAIDIIYDGVLISKELVEKFGCENIIKIYEAQKIISIDKVKEIPREIFEVIPLTVEALKGYIANKKTFELIIDSKNYEKEEYQDIFKMCFSLGLFSKLDNDTMKFIIRIISEKDEDYIHQMWTHVKLTTYNPKFKEVFIKLYNENKTEYNSQNIIGRLYSSFDRISKYTLKRHEEEISKKNTEIKRLKELGANTIYLEEEFEKLKKNKKDISYDDIIHYIKNNTFDIRQGNEALKSVMPELAIHMEQDGFDRIQDIYEKSIGVEKSIPLSIDKSDRQIRYHWSKSDNPINLILGYLVNCCAKLGGAGEDIMIQSMINPDIANLIIYDENNMVIGKATAYYNRKEKYILFNNAETKAITTKGLRSEKQRQKECLEALLRGTMDVINLLREKGEYISEVRVGMLRNDLKNAIEEYGIEIEHNKLLEAYNWKDYNGDASSKKEGQAVFYKDDQNYRNRSI